GYVKGTVFFHRGETASRYDTTEQWSVFRDRPLTQEENANLDAYLVGRRTGQGMINAFWENPRFEEPEPGFAVMFTNVTWDTAVQQRDRCFESSRDWILSTVRWFATQPQHRLLIRAHPAEVRSPKARSRERVDSLVGAAFPELPDNIRVIP